MAVSPGLYSLDSPSRRDDDARDILPSRPSLQRLPLLPNRRLPVLTVTSQQRSGKTCDGVSRRNFLKVGGLCVGGLTLADLLRLQAQGATAPGPTSKAVIMVWLEGGPSHLDIYDLKPNAPEDVRGPFKPIKTKVPGLEVCE